MCYFIGIHLFWSHERKIYILVNISGTGQKCQEMEFGVYERCHFKINRKHVIRNCTQILSSLADLLIVCNYVSIWTLI
jgi:hypothetical protein